MASANLRGNASNIQSKRKTKAILVIDVQKCFLPGGTLATGNSRNAGTSGVDGLATGICNFINSMPDAALFISKDWHPEGHASFGKAEKSSPNSLNKIGNYNPSYYKTFQQTSVGLRKVNRKWGSDEARMGQQMWPAHCIQGTDDSTLAPILDECLNGKYTETILKGVDRNIDNYSAIADALGYVSPYIEGSNQKFLERLEKSKITDIYVAGIARNFCVYSTVMDLLDLWILPELKKSGRKIKLHLLYNLTRPVAPGNNFPLNHKRRGQYLEDVTNLLNAHFLNEERPQIEDVFVIDEYAEGYEIADDTADNRANAEKAAINEFTGVNNSEGGRRRCRRRSTHKHCKCKKRSCKRCNSHNSRKSRKNRR